jgi:hypothetical protein
MRTQAQATIAAVLAVAGGASLPPGTATAKGPPCPPGPVEAGATFNPRADLGDGHSVFVARIQVDRGGVPLPQQVPYLGLVRRRSGRGSGYRPGYLYFPRRATDANGTAWVTVTVPSSGRWRYRIFPCPDGELQQSGPVPAAGVPGPPTPARSSPARTASEDAGTPWEIWAGLAAAIAAGAAALSAGRARARA